jgi:hypothetical protein
VLALQRLIGHIKASRAALAAGPTDATLQQCIAIQSLAEVVGLQRSGL